MIFASLLTGTLAVETLFFINSDCPIARRYSPEMRRISAEFSKTSKFKFVFCDPKFTPTQAKKHLKEFGLPNFFELDPTHEKAKKTGVKVVPTALVSVNGRTVYLGRIDDSYGSDFKWRKPKKFEVRETLQQIKIGRVPSFRSVTAIGCTL